MDLKKYFEREYNFLQQEGERFAERHQGIAGQLKLTQRQSKDPFVERLLEGFAFLAGRIHERLDDDFPEISGGLLELLCPHLIRPFPSCAILEARPVPHLLSKPVIVPRGSEVQTPTGKYQVKYKVSAGPQETEKTIEKSEPAEFIFRTTQELTVRPMQLKEIRVEELPDGASALVLQIHPHRNVSFGQLELKRLTLYLHGSDYLRYTLLLFLTKHVTRISVQELSPQPSVSQEIVRFRIGIPGISEVFDDPAESCALLPYAQQVFTGYRLLQEYFAYPERFFFIAVEGLEAFAATPDGCPFEIKIHFDRRLSPECRPSLKNILLHCAPIVNLFDRPTEEVIIDQRLPEYHILPDGNRRKSREIYSVNKVIGVSENKLQQLKYVPVTSYEILDTTDPEYEYKRFFSISTRPVRGDVAETYIRIFGPSTEQEVFAKETLSIQEAALTNGILPVIYLEAGAINQTVDFPAGIDVANLTTPSAVLSCPERKNFLWALLSHLTLSYATLANAETLKTLLSLYNWRPEVNNPNKKKIQAITKIHPPTTKYILDDRGLTRGIEFKMEVDENLFENGEGDIELFGSILNDFLSQYVTINSSVILTLVETGTKKLHTWPPKAGQILPV